MGSGRDGEPARRPLALRAASARDLQVFLGEALGGTYMELLRCLVVLVDGPALRAAELNGPRHDGREHRSEIQRRADGLPDLAQRRELAHGAGQRGGPLLQLVEQPYVLDGDHRLGRERLQELDLGPRERPG